MICNNCKVKDECQMYENVWINLLQITKDLKVSYDEHGMADEIQDVIDNFKCEDFE